MNAIVDPIVELRQVAQGLRLGARRAEGRGLAQHRFRRPARGISYRCRAFGVRQVDAAVADRGIQRADVWRSACSKGGRSPHPVPSAA